MARAYARVLQFHSHGMVRFVDDPDDADVSLIYMEADKVVALLREIPALQRTYRIGYFVWEADASPPERIAGMHQVNEVWTASLYNWHQFAKVHACVQWIPHLTDDTPTCTPEDIAAMKRRLAVQPQHFCVLNIGHGFARRKNACGLQQAFAYLHARHPAARLIMKTTASHTDVRVEHAGPVTWVKGTLTDAEVAALYGVAHVYASPHLSEGWGLTLSDAMQHGVLTVATHFSGNTEFMTRYNSLLVRCTESEIRQEDAYSPFTTKMRWAYPHRESLEAQLLNAYDKVQAGTHLTLTAQAKRDMRRFDARHIGVLVRRRLRAIATAVAVRRHTHGATGFAEYAC